MAVAKEVVKVAVTEVVMVAVREVAKVVAVRRWRRRWR